MTPSCVVFLDFFQSTSSSILRKNHLYTEEGPKNPEVGDSIPAKAKAVLCLFRRKNTH